MIPETNPLVVRASDLAPEFQPAVEAGGIPLATIAIVTVLLGAIAGLLWWMRSESELESPASDLLTTDLCDAHGLGAAQRATVEQLAKASECGHPAELFLSVEIFDRARATAEANRPETGTLSQAIGQLRRMLYDQQTAR
ncbi:MAG: hypothetical protein AAGD07_17050 [Planctomycetota bacterium]